MAQEEAARMQSWRGRGGQRVRVAYVSQKNFDLNLTLLSNEIRKRSNQKEHEGSGLVVMGRKGREEGKKGPGSSKASYFCHIEGH